MRYSDANKKLENSLKIRGKVLLTKSIPQNYTRNIAKRKLLVYKKEGKFYIDYAAAFSLGLTSVRPIMLGKQRFFEVDSNFLLKMQERKDIDIVYKELKKEKKSNSNKNETLTTVLMELEEGGYGIGVHCIDKGDSIARENIALNISDNGLDINNNARTILSTAISLGTNDNSQQLSEGIEAYRLGNGPKYSVVVAAPLCISDKTGKKIFLGFPDENKKTSGQQYDSHCILDRICSATHKIPPEFILGYLYEGNEGKTYFKRNLSHYSRLTEEQKEEIYRNMEKNMDDFSQNINELIENGETDKLKDMGERMKDVNLGTQIIDNAIGLVGKVVRRSKIQHKKPRVLIGRETQQVGKNGINEKRKPKILIDRDFSKGENLQRVENEKKKRILIGSYESAGISFSDLSQNAKRTYEKEGMEIEY